MAELTLDIEDVKGVVHFKGGEQNVVEDQEVQDGKIFAFIGYWGILCLIPLLFKKENKFALYHGKQGLVLLLVWVVLGVLSFTPLVILAPLLWIVLSILAIIGMIQALMGNYWKCPILSDMAEKIKI